MKRKEQAKTFITITKINTKPWRPKVFQIEIIINDGLRPYQALRRAAKRRNLLCCEIQQKWPTRRRER